MKPFYAFSTTNFGDHVNSWLWQEVAPEVIDDDMDVRLVGVGSLIKKDLGLVRGRKVIIGTGSGYGSPPAPEQVSEWDVVCVRGPETARLMGLDPRVAATDSAWLINRCRSLAEVPSTKTGGVQFIPHWTTHLRGNWAKACSAAGIEYVDPFADSKETIRGIARASLVITESLHGAIFADYFRTPWIAVSSPTGILPFKWHDWCASLGLDYQPYLLPPSDYLDCWLQGSSTRSLSMKPARRSCSRADRQTLVSNPPGSVNLRYRLGGRLKRWGRNLRKRAVDTLYPARDARVLKQWNDRHRERLSEFFSLLRRCEASLSEDSIRREKIAHLNDALDHIRIKYAVH